MKSIAKFIASLRGPSNVLKNFRLIAVALLLVLVPEVSSAESRKIVAVLPLSGRLANIGKDLQNAISLQETKGISVVYEDDSFDPKNTVSVVQKFLADRETKGFILFGSGTSLAVKPLIERSAVPAISVAMTDKIVEGSNYTFRYYPPGNEQASRIVKEIASRGFKNMAFIVSQQEAMMGIEAYFKNNLKFSDAHYFEVPPGETDVKSVASKVLLMKPDAMCLLLVPPELSAFAKQARALGYKGEFFGPTQVGNPDAVRAADGALENAWFTGIDATFAEELIKRYQAKFGFAPTSEAIAAYDAAGLLAQAAQTSNPAQFLRNPVGFSGLFGRELRLVTPNTFAPPLALKYIRGNEFFQKDH